MTIEQLLSLSPRDRCDLYRRKIGEHIPPKSDLDRRLIRNYQSCISAYNGHGNPK